MVSKFTNRLKETEANEHIPKEMVLLVNDDRKIAITTHDSDHINPTKMRYIQFTHQLCLHSKEEPCGTLLPNPVDKKLIELVMSCDKILYVNINGKTGDITKECWIPLEICGE